MCLRVLSPEGTWRLDRLRSGWVQRKHDRCLHCAHQASGPRRGLRSSKQVVGAAVAAKGTSVLAATIKASMAGRSYGARAGACREVATPRDACRVDVGPAFGRHRTDGTGPRKPHRTRSERQTGATALARIRSGLVRSGEREPLSRHHVEVQSGESFASLPASEARACHRIGVNGSPFASRFRVDGRRSRRPSMGTGTRGVVREPSVLHGGWLRWRQRRHDRSAARGGNDLFRDTAAELSMVAAREAPRRVARRGRTGTSVSARTRHEARPQRTAHVVDPRRQWQHRQRLGRATALLEAVSVATPGRSKGASERDGVWWTTPNRPAGRRRTCCGCRWVDPRVVRHRGADPLLLDLGPGGGDAPHRRSNAPFRSADVVATPPKRVVSIECRRVSTARRQGQGAGRLCLPVPR